MSITFYPTVARDQLPHLGTSLVTTRVLLPATSFAAAEVRRHGFVKDRLPIPRLPASVVERAADSGGFVASHRWGDYRFTVAQYVEWLASWQPQWAALLDYCCEPELAVLTRERQIRTTAACESIWQTYRSVPWAWVPTIQGLTLADYERHALELRPLIEEMRAWYRSHAAFRVGIGTLCRRISVPTIHAIVSTVAALLPGVPLHLWGVKLSVLQAPLALPAQVVSVDSAAWNGLFFTDREAWRASGLAQRQWSWTVAYPRYTAKVTAALARPKQLTFAGLAPVEPAQRKEPGLEEADALVFHSTTAAREGAKL